MGVSNKTKSEMKTKYAKIALELDYKVDDVYDDDGLVIVGLVPLTNVVGENFIYADINHADDWVSFGYQFNSPSGKKYTESLCSCNTRNIREGLELAREILTLKDRATELKLRSINENNTNMESKNNA